MRPVKGGWPLSSRRGDPVPAPERRLTVLHVLESLEGGTSRHLSDLVRHADGLRHVVAVPCTRVGGVTDRRAIAAMTAAGADVRLVEMRRSPAHPRNVAAYGALYRLGRAVRPEIVHAHSSIAGVLARALPPVGSLARVYTPHAVAQSTGALAIERLLARRTDRIVAVSDSEAALLRRLRVARPGQLVTIANGVDVRALAEPGAPDLRAMAGFPADCLLVGSLGRLLPQKAPERFVACARHVARQHPQAHFVLIGDGPMAGAVDALARCSELEGRYVRLPEVQGAGPTLAQLDVFVLLSRFEGAPYSPLEAMAGGTPAVLSDVVGNQDVLTGGLDELLVPAGDPRQAGDVVLRLLADPRLRRDLGASARRHVTERFEVTRMGRQYVQLYRELAAGPAGLLDASPSTAS